VNKITGQIVSRQIAKINRSSALSQEIRNKEALLHKYKYREGLQQAQEKKGFVLRQSLSRQQLLHIQS